MASLLPRAQCYRTLLEKAMIEYLARPSRSLEVLLVSIVDVLLEGVVLGNINFGADWTMFVFLATFLSWLWCLDVLVGCAMAGFLSWPSVTMGG